MGLVIASDNPITTAGEDLLGRAGLAHTFADELLTLDASRGLVVAVLGAWGSGKTSFMNLVREHLRPAEVPVLDFNPWMFSGAEQLVESFFVEIAAQLRLRPGFAEIASDLADYGEGFGGLTWLPLVGPWVDRARGGAKLLSKLLQRRREGIGGRRQRLAEELSKLDRPLVVVLDDIDRLTTAEIRDIFKLVRLTASFPNVIYLLAFDRARVEQALAEEGIPGRDYLEKILQLARDLPAVSERILDRQVLTAVDHALEGIENPGPFDEGGWPDVYVEVIKPLIRNLRDVRRYAAGVRGTVIDLGGEIALTDVLALEAIRVFLPEVFGRLPGSTAALTTTAGWGPSYGEDPGLKPALDELLDAAGSRRSVVVAMVQRLFPAAQRHLGGSSYGSDWLKTWLRERRVAHEELLRFYLERTAGAQLIAHGRAEQAFALLDDHGALERFMREMPVDELETVIGALEAYEDQYRPEQVVPAATVLLNLLPELPERPRGLFDLETRFVVGRVVYRLIRSLAQPERIATAVREILPRVPSLSSQFELITDVGYRENAGHKLVSEADAATFEREWRARVRAASAEQLRTENDLLRVLMFASRDLEPGEPQLVLPDDRETTLAVLRAAHTEVRSQSVGSRAIRREPRLVWEPLVALFGDEQTLQARLEAARPIAGESDDELIALAERYLSGWRPREFDSTDDAE